MSVKDDKKKALITLPSSRATVSIHPYPLPNTDSHTGILILFSFNYSPSLSLSHHPPSLSYPLTLSLFIGAGGCAGRRGRWHRRVRGPEGEAAPTGAGAGGGGGTGGCKGGGSTGVGASWRPGARGRRLHRPPPKVASFTAIGLQELGVAGAFPRLLAVDAVASTAAFITDATVVSRPPVARSGRWEAGSGRRCLPPPPGRRRRQV